MGNRAHLIVGGYPAGSTAGHDMDYARRRLLAFLGDRGAVSTVSNDYADLGKWLSRVDLLVTYVAGPTPNHEEHAVLSQWLASGGRWLALHGTSGGRAARIEGSSQRRMVKESHHETLGCFFLNHPPARRFSVEVHQDHPLTRGLPSSFDTQDELYLIEPLGDVLPILTTQLRHDPSPEGFGFLYEQDTSLGEDGRTRVLGYVRDVGDGSVAYIALGHCHSAASNIQPFVDESLNTQGVTPPSFLGSWETDAFEKLVRNGIGWGLGEPA